MTVVTVAAGTPFVNGTEVADVAVRVIDPGVSGGEMAACPTPLVNGRFELDASVRVNGAGGVRDAVAAGGAPPTYGALVALVITRTTGVGAGRASVVAAACGGAGALPGDDRTVNGRTLGGEASAATPETIPAEAGFAGVKTTGTEDVAGPPDSMPPEAGAAGGKPWLELAAFWPDPTPLEFAAAGASGEIAWVAVTLVGVIVVVVGEIARTTVKTANPADRSIPVRAIATISRRVAGIPIFNVPLSFVRMSTAKLARSGERVKPANRLTRTRGPYVSALNPWIIHTATEASVFDELPDSSIGRRIEAQEVGGVAEPHLS